MYKFDIGNIQEDDAEGISACISAAIRPLLDRSVRCRIDTWKGLFRIQAANLRGILENGIDAYKRQQEQQLAIPGTGNLLLTDGGAVSPPPFNLDIHETAVREYQPDFFGTRSFLRLPPVVKLNMSMNNHNWKIQDDYRRVWDFSRLESLHLHWVDILKFFLSVSPADLMNLRSLSLTNNVDYEEEELMPIASQLGDLFQTKCLQKLKIKLGYYYCVMPMSLICQLGNNLQVLSLQDWHEGDWKMMSPGEIAQLRVCQNLRDLRVSLPRIDSEV